MPGGGVELVAVSVMRVGRWFVERFAAHFRLAPTQIPLPDLRQQLGTRFLAAFNATFLAAYFKALFAAYFEAPHQRPLGVAVL